MFALAVVVLLFIFVFKTYMVRGESMLPTLVDGNRVFVLGAFYTPEQSDVIIMDESLQMDESIVKRVVATEGQIIDIAKDTGEITVDGIAFDSPVPASTDNLLGNLSAAYPMTVPDGHVFVMGDNRAHSYDSRFAEVGFVDMRNIIGKVMYVISPFDEIRAVR